MVEPDPPLAEIETGFGELPIRERLYQVISTLREPTDVATISDLADCDDDTVRSHFELFVDLGVVERLSGRPVRYVRNEEYFAWRYVTKLADSRSDEELEETIAELKQQREELAERYGASEPADLDLAYLQREEFDPEGVWDDISTWHNLSEEIRLHRRARQRLLDRREVSV